MGSTVQDAEILSSTGSIPEYRTPKYFQVQGVSAVSNPGVLRWAVIAVQRPKILRVLAGPAVYNPEILPILEIPLLLILTVCFDPSTSLYSRLLGASVYGSTPKPGTIRTSKYMRRLFSC